MKRISSTSFKLSGLALSLALAISAHAAPPTVNLTNIGNISSSIATQAQSNLGAAGSSYSSSTGISSASANGQATFNQVSPQAGGAGAAITLSGQTTTANSGNAFNVSTGNGQGTASTNGSSNASLDVAGTYSNPSAGIGNGYASEQQLALGGSIGTGLNDGNGGPANQGTSIGVNANTNGGGAINATTANGFTVAGTLSANTTTDGNGNTSVNVAGQVNDNKTSVSQVAVTNTLNVGMGTDANGNAITFATNPGNVSGSGSAGSSVNASGSFNDPTASITQ